ncbi:Uncharacterised protein r2_g4267 [Pycnogonum litorale]
MYEGPVNGYFVYRQVSGGVNHDVKALVKGEKLANSGYVSAISFAENASSYFFTGIVRAAMKKKVTYNFKLKLSQNGEIMNSHCECPGGKGPHGTCKHIAAVVMVIMKFKVEGILQVPGSCTDVIQQFHKPKKLHTSSPMKATDMLLAKIEDPRAKEDRNKAGYNDYVRSVTINYCSYSNKDIVLRYLYPEADLQTAAADHDYFNKPWTEYIIDKANKVTQKQASDIQKNTTLQAKCRLWHNERKWRLTASKFGEICKITPRRNIHRLCLSLFEKNQVFTRGMSHGRQYESVALAKFSRTHNLEVKSVGLCISVDHPYLAATPDGFIGSDTTIEVKCPYSGREMAIDYRKKPFRFLAKNNNKVALRQDHAYYIQIQGQLFVTRRHLCYFVVYTFMRLICRENNLQS